MDSVSEPLERACRLYRQHLERIDAHALDVQREREASEAHDAIVATAPTSTDNPRNTDNGG